MEHTDKPNFGREHRALSTVRRVSVTECDAFIRAHYLHKRPAVVMLCLLAEIMTTRAEPMGCVIYSAPPRESSKRYGGPTWELARLYLLDWVPRNAETWLIGKSVKYIKLNHPEVEYLVSYADSRQGHAGTIYKAANWIIDGHTDEGRKTPRNDLMDPKTCKIYSRWSAAPSGCIKVPRSRKNRFFYRMKSQ